MSNKKYIEIKIDNTNLDFSQDGLNLQLTFKNPCSGGFGTIQGNSSERSQTLPATKQNDSVFDNWWNVKEQNETTAPIEKDSEININGLNIFSGKAQMKKVTTQGRFYERQGKSYSVAFFGANADWFELLKDKELGRDLDWSPLQHPYTKDQITGRFNGQPINQICYTVLKMRDWAIDSSTGLEMVDVFQCTPAVFIGTFITKIFNSIGYTVESGNFFDNDVNGRYIMPAFLPAKYPQEFSEDYLNVAATKTLTDSIPTLAVNLTGLTFSNQTKTPLVGPNPYLTSVASSVIIGAGNVSRYTVPYQGFYQFNITVTIDNVVGSDTFVANPFSLNGGGLPNNFTVGQISVSAADNTKTYSFTVFGSFQVGAVIEFYAGAGAGITSMDFTGGTVEIIGEAEIVDGSVIDFKYLFRDWKITDFLKGLTAAFNLCWKSDPDLKTVTFLPSDNYTLTNKATSTSTIELGFHQDTTTDTTPKQDLSKNGSVTAINNTSEEQYYIWKNDGSDTTQEGLNLNEDVKLGASKYIFPSNRFKADTKNNENPFFAATVMFFDENIRHDDSELVPLVPILWPEDYRENTTAEENTTEFLPRLLWFGGQRGGDGTFNYMDTSTGNIFDANFPACFFVNYNDASGLDVSLSFSDRTIQGNIVKGHLRRFYLNEMARLRIGKRVEEWIYWDEVDILELDFMNKILLNGDMYILEEIKSFDPLIDSTTKTILLYDVGAEQQDLDALENTLALGVLSDYSDPD